jgi:hypothetical protein
MEITRPYCKYVYEFFAESFGGLVIFGMMLRLTVGMANSGLLKK